jgi:hypothetical protein
MAAWKAVVVEHAVLRPTVKHAVSAPVALLLARAVLFGLPGRSVPLEALVREPALFAFDVSLTLADVQRDTSLQVDRLGYDDVHVRVR